MLQWQADSQSEAPGLGEHHREGEVSRPQRTVIAVLGLAVVCVSCLLGSYSASYLAKVFPTVPSVSVEPSEVATDAPLPTPTQGLSPTPLAATAPLPTCPLPEPPAATASNTRVIPLTTPPRRSTPIPGGRLPPDAWEPDNSLAEARAIGIGERQTHNLHVPGDQDWVWFDALEGTVYAVGTSNLGHEMDSVICLYDAQANELTCDDDGGEEFLASRLWWVATETGRLYVVVRAFADADQGPGTTYDLSLKLAEGFEIDEHEPDDSLSEARPIAVGENETHNRHSGGDDDWMYFEARAGMTYVIETSNLGPDADTVVHLYDEAGQELGSDDDSGAEIWASRLEWTAPDDGVCYIMVEDWLGTSTGPGTTYDVSVRQR